jgi:GT2 family glycosyltransferase
MNLKISIVIPTFNHWILLHQILFDLYTNCSKADEVLVVNNGSTDLECTTGMDWWVQSKMLPIEEVKIEKNVGFLRAANIGVREAKGDVVILISNDVRVQCDLVDIVSKSVNDKTIVGGVLYDRSTGWNEFNGKVFPYLEGWLLAFTKQAWDDIGGFDRLYEPCDFEDVDFSTTAIRKGYTLVGLSNPNLYHMGGQTLGYNPEREKLTKINQQKFKDKWIK